MSGSNLCYQFVDDEKRATWSGVIRSFLSARARETLISISNRFVSAAHSLSQWMDLMEGQCTFNTQNFVLTDLRCFWLLFTIWPQTRIPWLVGRRSSRLRLDICTTFMCILLFKNSATKMIWSRELTSSNWTILWARSAPWKLYFFLLNIENKKHTKSLRGDLRWCWDGCDVRARLEQSLRTREICWIKNNFYFALQQPMQKCIKKPTGIPAPTCGSKLFDT